MEPIYSNEICATEDDLSPLMGCMLTDICEGIDDDGTEFATLVFYNPGNRKYIRLSVSENSELSLSDFEED